MKKKTKNSNYISEKFVGGYIDNASSIKSLWFLVKVSPYLKKKQVYKFDRSRTISLWDISIWVKQLSLVLRSR